MEIKSLINSVKFEKSSGVGSTTYLTHNFHTYPAKFIPQIPKKTIEIFSKPGDTILDPFCGCGTTLVEAKLSGRNSIGVDLNPIATLVSKVKSNPLSEKDIFMIRSIVQKSKNNINKFYKGKISEPQIPDFYNRDHWFQKNVLSELALIKQEFSNLNNISVKNFLMTAFSSIIVSVSNQESDTRFAAINKEIPNGKVIQGFEKKITQMLERIKSFNNKASKSIVKVFNCNTLNLNCLEDNSVDHVVTSPPYANTYDYYLYHKFRMYWLDYKVKSVQDEELGSRNRHSSKKENINTFEDGLLGCFKEIGRVLKKNKVAIVVIGDSVIRGQLIKANYLMKMVAEKCGFEFVREISYNLKKNTKLFNPKFTNKDKSEHIMFFINKKCE